MMSLEAQRRMEHYWIRGNNFEQDTMKMELMNYDGNLWGCV